MFATPLFTLGFFAIYGPGVSSPYVYYAQRHDVDALYDAYYAERCPRAPRLTLMLMLRLSSFSRARYVDVFATIFASLLLAEQPLF